MSNCYVVGVVCMKLILEFVSSWDSVKLLVVIVCGMSLIIVLVSSGRYNFIVVILNDMVVIVVSILFV